MSKWDERYLTDDYVFGTEPNQFIARILPLLPKGGRALDLATGEGRNGIFLAEHGFEAEGVDMSAVGLEKAQKLAAEKGVRFATRQENIAEMALPPEALCADCQRVLPFCRAGAHAGVAAHDRCFAAGRHVCRRVLPPRPNRVGHGRPQRCGHARHFK
jgi:SAM-dependent methyltransferase